MDIDTDSSLQVIWCDSNIFSDANVYITVKFSKKFIMTSFDEIEDTVQFLNSNTSEKYVVMTSGSFGEKLVNQIENLSHVPHIIIFCCNVEFHYQWAQNHPKIIGVYSDWKIIESVLDNIKANLISGSSNLDPPDITPGTGWVEED